MILMYLRALDILGKLLHNIPYTLFHSPLVYCIQSNFLKCSIKGECIFPHFLETKKEKQIENNITHCAHINIIHKNIYILNIPRIYKYISILIFVWLFVLWIFLLVVWLSVLYFCSISLDVQIYSTYRKDCVVFVLYIHKIRHIYFQLKNKKRKTYPTQIRH